jgi:uncharacterized protein
MPPSFPAGLIDFLMKPESYPHKPDRINHIQTHISHVFIASPFVFKFKKPVDFDFLDFSTLEKRKFYCEQEVELNSRLCGSAYLGFVPIYEQEGTWSFDPNESKLPAEYCVWMKQLPKKNFLIEYVRKNRLTRQRIVCVLPLSSEFPYKRILDFPTSVDALGTTFILPHLA